MSRLTANIQMSWSSSHPNQRTLRTQHQHFFATSPFLSPSTSSSSSLAFSPNPCVYLSSQQKGSSRKSSSGLCNFQRTFLFRGPWLHQHLHRWIQKRKRLHISRFLHPANIHLQSVEHPPLRHLIRWTLCYPKNIRICMRFGLLHRQHLLGLKIVYHVHRKF